MKINKSLYRTNWTISLALALLLGALALGFCLMRLPSKFVYASDSGPLMTWATPSTGEPASVESNRLNFQLLLRQVFADLQFDVAAVPETFIDKVVEQLHTLTVTHRRPTQEMLDRSAPYMKIIDRVLSQQRLPALFAVIPFVESTFDVDAMHPETGARGIWQFMPATARAYGLNVSEAIDERLDPYWSTFAASRYLKELQNIFGDQKPLLVLAAYNFGEANLSRAIVRSRARNIWKLFRIHQIPNETRHYLVKAIAIWCVRQYADDFRFVYQPDESLDIMRYADIAFPYPSTLADVAKRTALEERQLRTINRHLLTGYLPAFATIRMPIDQVETFLNDDVKFSLAWDSRRCCSEVVVDENCLHTVKAGENLSLIASRFPISIAAIKRLNRLNGVDPIIRPGQKLIVCQPSMATADPDSKL